MAKKIISFKPNLFNGENQESCFLTEQINQKTLLNQYKLLKKRMKSGNFSENKGFLYILSKKWLKKWKDSAKNSEKIDFSSKYNEDLIDFERNSLSFESIGDIFLLKNLEINKDFIVISSEIQCFFEKISQGFPIKRRISLEKPSNIVIYPFEKAVILITDEVLKEIEFTNLSKFKRNMVQFDNDMNCEEFKEKYLNLVKNQMKIYDKSFKISSIRMWKCDFSHKNLEFLFENFKENCKKCMRNYVFYMKNGNFIDNSMETAENEGFLLDIREFNGEFHLIREETEKIVKCDFCSIFTISAIFCQCDEISYCSLDCKEKDWFFHSKTCEKAVNSEEISDFTIKETSIKGLCGLKNIGNSCYMNSALQCISNSFELTQYFLSEKFKFHLNLENKLGSQGKIARKYADFLRNMWCETNKSFEPIRLKALINKRNFGEFSQEDSQEFLAFMLDMLHEDLNRNILENCEKMYVKNPENTEENDAKESWNSYQKRNNSIIVDLFNGQFKSKITCPECKKISITFEPFLMVPLPISQRKRKTIMGVFVRKEANSIKEKINFGYFSNENH